VSADGAGMTRRRLVVVVALAAGALGGGALVARLGGASGADGAARPASAVVRAYFGPLVDGSRLDRWTLVRVFDVRDGAIPVVLATPDGSAYQIDLLRRDPAGPRGVAETTQLSLFIANHGDGGTTTPEERGQGILALAAALTTRERAGAAPPALSSMNERLAAFPVRHSAVPLDRSPPPAP
jgi:hypothetical protein